MVDRGLVPSYDDGLQTLTTFVTTGGGISTLHAFKADLFHRVIYGCMTLRGSRELMQFLEDANDFGWVEPTLTLGGVACLSCCPLRTPLALKPLLSDSSRPNIAPS
jgi:hypothetical protein